MSPLPRGCPAEPSKCPSKDDGPLTWEDGDFDFSYIDGRRWKLKQDFRFHYSDETLHLHGVVPAGFVTDFHSIPRFFYRVAHPFEYGQAAVIHDHLYRKGSGVTREEADVIYRAALDKCGCPPWRQALMFRALRIFGWAAYKRNGGADD